MSWKLGPGVVELPDGARLRGRSLKREQPPTPAPEWGLYLLGEPPPDPGWPTRWVRWIDFWVPSDERLARLAFEEAHLDAAAGVRVEVACGGGKGRTGTALACIAQLGGVQATDAISWVRTNYARGAIETPWQRSFVRRFSSTAIET